MTDSRPRIAPQIVFDVAPGLGRFNEKVLFGKVWPDPALAPRDRSLITLAALVALGRVPQVGFHTARGLDNGLAPVEIAEILSHLAFYAGWPVAMSAVAEVGRIFSERGIGPLVYGDAVPLVADPAAEDRRKQIVAANVAPVAPALAADTDEVLFADLWLRPQLAPRDRSLVTMAALIAMGQAEQLGFHLSRALDNGLTEAEAGEVLRHIAYYAGWPRAMSAVGALCATLEARRG